MNPAWALFLGTVALPSMNAQTAVSLRVTDPTGAALPEGNVVLQCAGIPAATLAADADGIVHLRNVSDRCVARVSAAGFLSRQLSISSSDYDVQVRLEPAAIAEVTVSADEAPVLSTSTTAQQTLTGKQIAAVPLFNGATGFTDLLTRTTPGVAADANGFAHPLGEHADTSISLDGQPITDQQAKVFANQIDPNIIESLTATTGAPPAEFGDKTSLVVTVNTRSGLGHKPHGSLAINYGGFGTWTENLAVGAGGKRWGEFIAIAANGSSRYLDSPELQPLHDRGNGTAVFNRIDWQPDTSNSLHLNLGVGRSWFQTPNSYVAAAAGQDQRSEIRNVNVAVGWNHVVTPWLVTSFTPFFRHDQAQYLPSANPLADSTATLQQERTLTNTGFRLDGTYVRGAHTAKLGGTYWHTLPHEQFAVALTDPLYNSPCVDTAGNAVAAQGVMQTGACAGVGYLPNADFLPPLLPFDLTRGGSLFRFDQKADVAETALYAQDEMRLGDWVISTGLRYDIYNGLSRGRQVQPRVGLSWKTPFTHTVLRGSYARMYQTPYNENLIFANESSSATAGTNPFASFRSEPVRPGTRNQFNVGFEQALGDHLSVNADYYWKFTRNDFDFDTLFNTPITFSVAWRKSKIDGLALTANLRDWHGVTVMSVMGHVRSRFFTPQVGGVIFNSVPSSPVFRIDHGEEFEHTTDVRYELPVSLAGKHRPFISGTWRYNSGLALPDTVPTYLDALQLSADEQSQMGLRCGTDSATPTRAIRTCSQQDFSATRIRIPAFGTQDDDRNPVRVMPRTLLDFSAGDDHLLQWERVVVGVHAGVQNAANNAALYNFLSTFSGTHFVPPRSVQAGVRLSF